ncbi:MAG: SDR family NAD(P)-dependent oxidoreductase [Gammaproteobacteria bacterium]|nr:SDR family NAD(P)-dependent oxidoreductase [Gammaproteobacteria bacterium]
MPKTILITGSTDGIGLATAKLLVTLGHHVVLHGRNPNKLEKTEKTLSALAGTEHMASYVADLSQLSDVVTFANAVAEKHNKLDVLINNAGVFKASETRTQDGLDVRFAVNTIAPYLLTQQFLPLLGPSARVINLSSAAQSPVDPKALAGQRRLPDMEAYAQSKLALTMWSRSLALSLGDDGPVIIAVNPGSLLGTKMVKQGFGVAGGDIRKGADILVRAALAEEFATASGQYFDNDTGRFGSPHPNVLEQNEVKGIVHVIEAVLADKTKAGAEAP